MVVKLHNFFLCPQTITCVWWIQMRLHSSSKHVQTCFILMLPLAGTVLYQIWMFLQLFIVDYVHVHVHAYELIPIAHSYYGTIMPLHDINVKHSIFSMSHIILYAHVHLPFQYILAILMKIWYNGTWNQTRASFWNL